MVVRSICEGNRRAWRKPSTLRKKLTNFITQTLIYLKDTHIFWAGELTKQSTNFKYIQRKKINYFHVNRYIIWICQRFVKQNKISRFPVHMKASHKSKKM